MKIVKVLPDDNRRPGAKRKNWAGVLGEARKIARGRRVWVCVGVWGSRFGAPRALRRLSEEGLDVGWEFETRKIDGEWQLWARTQPVNEDGDE